MSEELLRASLSAAVPLWIERVKAYSPQVREDRARHAVDVIASKGDNILYRSKVAGETAMAFNTLAEAIAIMAFQPGGVEFDGMHWEVVSPSS